MASRKKITPTREQARVVEAPEREIIVAAGAGTGKTKTVEFRIGSLLDKGTDLSQILIFTFTEKAAGELADKVRETSAERLNKANPGAATMSEAWVGTFHSICARILRSFPIEADVDPGFGILDDIDSAAVKATAARMAIQRLLNEMPEASTVVARFRIEALQGEIEEAYDKLRSRGIPDPRLPLDQLPTEYPAKLVGRILKHAERMVKDSDRGKGSPRTKAQALVNHLNQPGVELTAEIARKNMGSGKAKDLDFNELTELLKDALGKLVAYEDNDLTYRAVSRLIELFGEIYSELKEQAGVLDFEDLQIRTVELLNDREHPEVGCYYRGRFREIMVDEFQDTNGLQLQLIEALAGDETTVLTVGDEMQSIYRFRHANVELFRSRRTRLAKDANGADLKLRGNNRSDRAVIDAVNLIGRALHESAASATARAKGDRHEFMDLEPSKVSKRGDGDPGNIRLLLTERGDWGPLDLGEISPAVPAGEEEGGVHQAGKEETGSDAFREAEAVAVARAIRDLLDDRSEDFGQKDVAILLRAMTHAGKYEQALKQVGLTPYVISGRGFWKSRVAIEVRSLLGLIANPLDEEAVLAAILSPACGVSSDAPLILRQGSAGDEDGKRTERLWDACIKAAEGEPGVDNWFLQLSPDDRESLISFVGTIEALRGEADLLPLDELIEAVASRTGYDLVVLRRDPASFPDLKRIASIARTYEDGHRRDLRGFLDWMESSETADSEASVAIEDENSEVVKIMTIHAAKGDEFEVVVVPDLGRQFKSDGESLLMLGPSGDPHAPEDFSVGIKVDGNPAYDWAKVAEQAKFENEDEELRLFHVAVTRAQSHLIMSGCPPDVNKDGEISSTTSIATRICEQAGIPTRPDEEGKWPDGPAAEHWAGKVQVELNPANEETAGRISKPDDPLVSTEASEGGNPPLWRPEGPGYPIVPLSFTALLEYATCPTLFFAKRILRLDDQGYAPPGEGPEGTPLGERDDAKNFDGEAGEPGIPMEEREDARAFGSVVHDLLEVSSGRKWAMPDDDEITAALTARGLDPDDGMLRKKAGEMVDDFLSSELGETVKGCDSSAEVPMLLRFDNVTIRGFIDLLVETPVVTVIDFKTNDLTNSSPEEKMATGYGLQRDLYALAVAEAYGLEAVETAFVFLRAPADPVKKAYDSAELTAARERVGKLVDGVVEGAYFDEGGPVAPCGSCWACRKLERGT